MKNKNILEISDKLWIGWTEKVMQIYCQELSKRWYNVYVCWFFESWLRYNNFLKFSKSVLIADWSYDTLINYIENNNIKIIHWHLFSNKKENFNGLKNFLEYCNSNWIKVIETAPFSLYHPHFENLIDLRIFVSSNSYFKFMRKFKNRRLSAKNYTYIYNPLDFDNLEENSSSKDEIGQYRKMLGISKEKIVIWKIWRADYWKWDNSMIYALKKLEDKYPWKYILLIRSMPIQVLPLIRKLKLEGSIINLPETINEKELALTYSVIDIMLHISRIWESFWVTLVESMYFKIPIITNSTDFQQFTLYDRDNSQIEIVNDWVNWFINQKLDEIVKSIEFLSKKSNRLMIWKFNHDYVIKNFGKEKIIDEFINGLSLLESHNRFNKKLIEYNPKKQDFLTLIKINLIALVDKFLKNVK